MIGVKMIRRFFLIIFTGLFLTFQVIPHSEAIEFSYLTLFIAHYEHTKLAQEWANEITKRTKGRVIITIYPYIGEPEPGQTAVLLLQDGRTKIYPGGTGIPADKFYEAVEKGICDIAMSQVNIHTGKFPLTEVIDLPLGYKSASEATKLINDYYRKFRPNEFDNTKILYFHARGPVILHTRKAVHKLEDLKGMKIRCDGMGCKVVNALGGVPVTMNMIDTYFALERGAIDGIMAPQEILLTLKLAEVVNFTTESFGSSYSTGFFIVMNKDKWNGLPSDIQKIIEEVNEEWIEKSGKTWDDLDRKGREFMLKEGDQIISLSPEENDKWEKAVQPIISDYLIQLKTKGLPGEEVLKFCSESLKINPAVANEHPITFQVQLNVEQKRPDTPILAAGDNNFQVDYRFIGLGRLATVMMWGEDLIEAGNFPDIIGSRINPIDNISLEIDKDFSPTTRLVVLALSCSLAEHAVSSRGLANFLNSSEFAVKYPDGRVQIRTAIPTPREAINGGLIYFADTECKTKGNPAVGFKIIATDLFAFKPGIYEFTWVSGNIRSTPLRVEIK